MEMASIPVERTRGAVLLLSGRGDRMWPSSEMCAQIERRLDAHAFDFPYAHRAYGCSHNGLIRDRALWRDVFEILEFNFQN